MAQLISNYSYYFTIKTPYLGQQVSEQPLPYGQIGFHHRQ